MLGRQPPAEQFVVGARGHSDSGHVADRQHHRDALATDAPQGRPVAEPGGGQDDGVDPAAQEMIQDPREAFRLILGFANQRHQSGALEPVRDPPQHGRDERIAEVGDHHRHGVRAAPLQAAGDHIALVAHSSSDRLDVFARHRVDAPDFARVQRPGHCRVVHAGRPGDILQRHDASCPAQLVALPPPATPPFHRQAAGRLASR